MPLWVENKPRRLQNATRTLETYFLSRREIEMKNSLHLASPEKPAKGGKNINFCRENVDFRVTQGNEEEEEEESCCSRSSRTRADESK